MADEAVKKTGVKKHLVDDVGGVWKRWSTWITTLMVTAQATWALVPSEAREMLPKPQYLGLGLGVAALIASMLKQGKKDGGTEE